MPTQSHEGLQEAMQWPMQQQRWSTETCVSQSFTNLHSPAGVARRRDSIVHFDLGYDICPETCVIPGYTNSQDDRIVLLSIAIKERLDASSLCLQIMDQHLTVTTRSY